MSTTVDSTGTKLVHSLRYRDLGVAIDWLCTAFGFERHRIVTGVDGTILHAQLSFGDDMIMLLPISGSNLDGDQEEIGSAEMQSCYFLVEDADLHHCNAKAAGADILDINQYEHGGHGYSCRDPEGHIWKFDTCNPRQTKPAYDRRIRKSASRKRMLTTSPRASLRDKLNPSAGVIVAAMVAAVVSAATVGWMLVALPLPGASGKENRLANTAYQRADEAAESAALRPGEPAQVKSMAFIATLQRAEDGEQVRAPEVQEPSAEVAAEHEARQTTKVDQERSTQDAAERAAQATLRQLARERSAKEAAGHATIEARKRLANVSQDARELASQGAAKDPAKRGGKDAQKRLVEKPSAKTRAIEPATERNADEQFWDCLPSPTTGHIVCRPQEKKPVLGAVMKPAAQSARTSAVEPAKDLRQSPERKADEQLWDCLPSPIDGQVHCHPIGHSNR